MAGIRGNLFNGRSYKLRSYSGIYFLREMKGGRRGERERIYTGKVQIKCQVVK